MKNPINKLLTAFCNTFLYALAMATVLIGATGIDPVHAMIGSYVTVELVSPFIPMGVMGADAYSDTVLQAARAFIKDENNKKFQLRPTFTNILDVFKRDREYSIPNLAALRMADTQTTTAMYLKKKDFTIGTAKDCAPSGETSGSAKVDLTWATKTIKIVTNYKQHAGNEVSMARALANDLYNAEVSLWTSVDSALLTYLEANKSGVNAGGSGTFLAGSTDIMEITNTNKQYFYNLVTADMQKNNYSPSFLEVHDTMWTAEQRKYINQGAGNSVNTQFQFAGFEFFPSNLITPGVIGNGTYTSVHYIIPSGGVAILDWNDPLNRNGKQIGYQSWGTFQSLLHPEFTLDLFKVTACGDTSSSGGGTQDYTETWELAFNYALAKQPVPTANETPIFKYGVLSGDTYAS